MRVVAVGFALSAAGHAVEWSFFDSGRAIAVIVYLHLAAVGAVLLSGFWSIVAERDDPEGARASYGRIAAAGTAGGIAGSFAAERLATTVALHAVLVLLVLLHVLCALGVTMIRHAPTLLPQPRFLGGAVRRSWSNSQPGGDVIALFVLTTSATTAVIDFLLKSNARAAFGAGLNLLRFFALYYGVVQIVSFVAQMASSRGVRELGVGGAVNAMPAGVGAASLVALMFPGWAFLTTLRAGESVLRQTLCFAAVTNCCSSRWSCHATAREGDPRRHLRSHGRGGRVRHRSVAAGGGGRLDHQQPAAYRRSPVNCGLLGRPPIQFSTWASSRTNS